MNRPRRISLDRTHPFAGAVIRAIAGDASALDEASEVLHGAEIACGIGLSPGGPNYPPLRDEDVPAETAIAFLDATSFVVDGEWLQTQLLMDRTGHERLFSLREWGHHVAAWANRRFPNPDPGRVPQKRSSCGCAACSRASEGDFIYLDFYSGPYTRNVLPDYDRWRDAVAEVVRHKVSRFGEPFARETAAR